jgi:Zn finger protein HypA/HybF involved in hydrogenase expression
MSEQACGICKADFPTSVMIDGKCKKCQGEHPDVETLEEFKEKQNKDDKRRTLSEKVVKDIVYEILENEVGLKRIRCAKCQAKFFQKSPAQKYCEHCKSKKDEGPKDNATIEKENK